MSVKIEILDYVYGDIEGIQMISNSSFATSTDWNEGGGWSIASGKATHTANISGYLDYNNVTFVEGQTYRIKYEITGRTSGQFILANHLTGNQNGYLTSTDGIHEYDWVQGGGNLTRLRLFGSSDFNGSIEYAEVYQVTGIDWDKSIVGELDVTDHSDFPLALTFQISDFKDLTSTSGDYSKTFKVPATKNNNNLLKHLYIPDVYTDNNVIEKKPCKILVNNLYSITGLIKVNGVSGNGKIPSHYECVFFGSNLTWASSLQDSYMSDINWGTDGENLTYNMDTISATWQDEDCTTSDSPIVYPVTSYGEYNAEGVARTIQLLDTFSNQGGGDVAKLGYYGFANNGQNYGTPAPVSDWRPSVFVKTTLDKIFSDIGYSISSVFMNTDMFKKLVWLLPNFQYNNPDERAILYGFGNKFSGEGYISQFSGLADSRTIWNTTRSVANLNDATDFVLRGDRENIGWGSDGIFTVQEYGYYTIKMSNFGFYWDNYSGSNGGDVTNIAYFFLDIELQTVGQNSWNRISRSQTQGNSFTASVNNLDGVRVLPNVNFQRFFNKNDKIRLVVGSKMKNASYVLGNQTIDISFFGSNTPTSSSTSNRANAFLQIDINALPVSYGQTYNLNDVINKEYNQIDFIKGISHSFNLQMTTNDSEKQVTIEPFNDFYKPFSKAVDWTNKLNRINQTSDKFIENDLKRRIVFKYKSDNADAKVKGRAEYFDGIDDNFPFWDTLPDTFDKGESEFENPFFAGTYEARDQDTIQTAPVDTAFSSCLWTEDVSSNDEGRPVKGTDFLPRLLYWNKYSPSSAANQDKRAVVQVWAYRNERLVADSSISQSGIILSDIYPQATMINPDSDQSPVLSYGNIWVSNYEDSTGIYADYTIGKGLYETYYSNSIEMIKKNPRLRTVSIDLKISDIVNLDFRKLIYIDGVYWRLNKIIDYMPNQNNSTKVQLIEWFELGIFSATAPKFGSSGSGNTNDWGDPAPDEWWMNSNA